MRRLNRKTGPKVIGGVVQKKNNWARSPNYYICGQRLPVIDRKRPGKGYRHLLKQKDIHDFISILPDWDDLSIGLNAIVLAPGSSRFFGYHTRGVVHLCAWDEDLWLKYDAYTLKAGRPFLEKLGVVIEPRGGDFLCKFDEPQARAHQLLDTALHELGHHHDRMTTSAQRHVARGEDYAESYSRQYAERIWTDYQDVFGVF